MPKIDCTKDLSESKSMKFTHCVLGRLSDFPFFYVIVFKLAIIETSTTD